VSYLVDVDEAIIRVRGEGKYFEPKFGQTISTPGYGSGFIIDPSGIAVTTSQAVVGADQLQVWVGEDQDTSYQATVLGVDDCTDLALIKIEGQNFKYLQWSDNPLQQDQKIYVGGFSVGIPNYDLELGTVKKPASVGSTARATGKILNYLVKTQPGYAGGPIVNPEGKVVGVNQTGDAESQDAMGLAASTARPIIAQMLAGIAPPSLGVNGEALLDQDNGLSGIWAYSVVPGSLAQRAGLQAGDLITNLAGEDLGTDGLLAAYCAALDEIDLAEPVDVQIYRSTEGLILQGQLNGRPLSLGGANISGTPGAGVAINLDARDSGDIYFKEEFENGEDNWKQFLTSGDPEKVTSEVKNGKLRTQIDGKFTYVYDIFDPLRVANAKIELTAENLGRNNNNVSLICRYSNRGWYEFNIANNGLYWVKRYDPNLPDADKYVTIGKGGSRNINMGRGTNQYAVSCKGNQLTLWINGDETSTFTDNALISGKVGFSISSFEVLPIIVEVDDFMVSVP
jgi:S1-C subfamily serine protease